MSAPTWLRTAHLDGFRVRESEESGRILVDVCFYAGAVVADEPIRIVDLPDVPDSYPQRSRAAMLGRAIARFINAGGTSAELSEMVRTLQHSLPTTELPLGFELVGVEEDASYAYTLRRPAGDYLRIIEDETYEILDEEALYDLVNTPDGSDTVGGEI